MSKLLLSIIIACSLGLSGCTEDQEGTENKQLDDALGIKTEEKVESKESEKTEIKTTDNNKKKDTKTKKEQSKTEKKADNNSKKSDEDEPDPQSEEEMAKRVNNRDIVVGQCIECNRTIRRSEIGIDRDYLLCKDCYNKGYTKCLNCGKTINGYDEGIVNGSSGSLCSEECAKQFTSDYCSKCGKEVDVNTSGSYVYDDYGILFCPDCYFAEHEQVGDAPEE